MMTETTRVCRLHGKEDLRIDVLPVDQPKDNQVLIRVSAGGICGSDLHYYYDGGIGPIRVKEPIILGHEFSGSIEKLGKRVTGLAVGDKVAINPSNPCGSCEYCKKEMSHHCTSMRFSGSAMRLPHTQGGFRDRLIVNEAQCVKVDDQTSLSELACTEPLAVALHALSRAGPVRGKRVLVTGAGPIGCLCVAVAKQAGATEVVATDLFTTTLDVAKKMGATAVINARENTEPAGELYDIAFECSASPQAIQFAVEALKPQSTLIQVGVSGATEVPLNKLVAKEINHIGSHRFHREFVEAARLIESRKIDVRPIITETIPLLESKRAFELARDRSQAVKVHLSFTDNATISV